jgi:hypothetical protein
MKACPYHSIWMMIFDGSKEQTLRNFKRKLREADCHGRQTEPYSPWQNAAEGCIRELKRGVSRKMMKTGSPKVLWDHCIELEALIRSNTSNDIYMTSGEVLETIMTGSTADISHICEFAWYDWVMFRDNILTFPDDKLILGCYLGPAIDIGSALTASFMRQMGYKSCKADPDLWLKAETRPDDNVRYYSYILCYVDDILKSA